MAIWTACAKNFGGVFFSLFYQTDQDSKKILPKYWLWSKILDLLSLLVHNCSTENLLAVTRFSWLITSPCHSSWVSLNFLLHNHRCLMTEIYERQWCPAPAMRTQGGSLMMPLHFSNKCLVKNWKWQMYILLFKRNPSFECLFMLMCSCKPSPTLLCMYYYCHRMNWNDNDGHMRLKFKLRVVYKVVALR